MKKLLFITLLLTNTLISYAQFGFNYSPLDSTYTNYGGWSFKPMYIQKDTTPNTDSYFMKFYHWNLQFVKHGSMKNDGVPSSILWTNDTGKVMRSPVSTLHSILDSRYLQSFSEIDPVYKSDSSLYGRKTYIASLYFDKTASDIRYFAKPTGTISQYLRGDGSLATLPSGYTFTGSASQYTKGDGTYATFPTNLNSFTNGPGYITGNQSITLSGDITGSGTTAITTTLSNSGASAGTYNGSYTVDAKGRVTSASNKTQSSVTPSLNSPFQVSSTLAADVNYSIKIQCTSLLTGSTTGTVQLQISTTSGGSYTTISTSEFTVSGLIITLANTQTIGGFIPPGYWVKIVTATGGTNPGSVTFTSQAGQQTTY